jgi:S-methylmethionine-dependent homocysteine/selenocysteine methylase
MHEDASQFMDTHTYRAKFFSFAKVPGNITWLDSLERKSVRAAQQLWVVNLDP